MTVFENLGLIEALILFVICALAVWRAGSGLAYVADALSDRFRWEKSLVGLMALSTATSLPEIATTFSAAASQSRELVLNNLFGGIALQTAILAMADFWGAWCHHELSAQGKSRARSNTSEFHAGIDDCRSGHRRALVYWPNWHSSMWR